MELDQSTNVICLRR